jgi:hypothetical protein
MTNRKPSGPQRKVEATLRKRWPNVYSEFFPEYRDLYLDCSNERGDAMIVHANMRGKCDIMYFPHDQETQDA